MNYQTIVYFFNLNQSGTPIEISLCYFTNFNHPQRDQLFILYKTCNHSLEHFSCLTQCGLIWPLRRDHFIIKLINLLIRELNNYSLGGDFRVSQHAEMCQFDRFSSEINFKRARSCNYVIPWLVQVKMNILYSHLKVGDDSLMIRKSAYHSFSMLISKQDFLLCKPGKHLVRFWAGITASLIPVIRVTPHNCAYLLHWTSHFYRT